MPDQPEKIQITQVLTQSNLKMLLPKEAAAELGVSVTMLRELVITGELRFIPWGNERRIPRWELRRWQEEKLKEYANSQKVFSILDSLNKNQRYKGKKK